MNGLPKRLIKVLSRFTTTADVKLTLRVQVASPSGISEQAVEETRAALRELGLPERPLDLE
ncbi:MAG: hypothetical protein QME96_03850 [Myxococcota bacterium]|nr:hypothetical protein [Myxococcota bacterium]